MIKEVFNRWRVDKKKSFMIGDRLKDYQAAKVNYILNKCNQILKIKLIKL